MRHATLALAFALALAPLVLPSAAAACENASLVELSQVMRRLDHAESELHGGRTREAMRDAVWVVNVSEGRAHGYELSLVGSAEQARARRLAQHGRALLALAVVRRDGRVDRRRWQPTSRIPDETRRANLDWALGVLERAAASREPLARARFAEALSRYEPRREEARAILAELARADTMPDAWGYRILAELSDRTGDVAARNDAIARCHARAGVEARTVCPRLVAVR